MKKIKHLFVKSAITVALFTLYGCDDSNYETYDETSSQEAQKEFIADTVKQQTLSEIQNDSKELKDALKQMQERDPSIVNLYYGVNDKGEKELHIVKDDSPEKSRLADDNDIGEFDIAEAVNKLPVNAHSNGDNQNLAYSGNKNTDTTLPQAQSNSTYTDYVFPMAGGLVLGMLLNKFMSGGMVGLNNTYHPTSYSNLNNEERRKRKNVATSSYIYSSAWRNNASVRNNIQSGKMKMPESYKGKSLTTRQSGFFKSNSSARSSGYSKGG